MRPNRHDRTGPERPPRERARTAGAVGVIAVLAVALATAAPAVVAADDTTAPGLRIVDGELVEADGSPLVLRGVNHAHTWYPQHSQAFADIGALGANAVRTVLSSGDLWTRNDIDDVRDVIRFADEARMISVLEVHDTTGYGEEGAAASLAQATDYWISVKDAVIGHEDRVLVNIGNEPFGNDEQANARYVPDTIAAIERLRDAGIRNTIVVDAPNWGQDWSGTMRDNAAQIFAADPDANVLFSVHMYGVYEQAGAIRAYLDAFETAGLPLIIGEFGHTHSDGEVDEDTILRETRARGIGWLGWSWSGNSGGVEYLDLAQDFDPNRLSSWGQRLFHGPDGIAETSVRASVFSDAQPGPGPGPDPDPEPTPDPDPGPTPDPEPGPSPDPGPDPSAVCAAEYRTLNSWPGGFQGEVVVTGSGTTALTGWQVSWTFPGGQDVTQAWNTLLTQQGTTVSAGDVGYNATLQPGSGTSFGFIGTGEAPTSTVVTCSGTGSTG